jgi:hypothetical protein
VIPGDKPPPLESLDEKEAEIWVRVVGALPGGWFGPECHDLLVRYCEVMARSEKVSERLRQLLEKRDSKDYIELLKAQRDDLRIANMLAVTLRFAPKARMSNGKAQSIYGGTAIANKVTRDRSPVRPWETKLDEDHDAVLEN